jgi:hypothetical protein
MLVSVHSPARFISDTSEIISVKFSIRGLHLKLSDEVESGSYCSSTTPTSHESRLGLSSTRV